MHGIVDIMMMVVVNEKILVGVVVYLTMLTMFSVISVISVISIVSKEVK